MTYSEKPVHETFRSRLSNRWACYAGAGLVMTLGFFCSSPVTAQALDGNAIRELALQGTWEAEKRGLGYWTWSGDNTVCLRLISAEGDCADTGTWSVDGDVMCYELTWWGRAYDITKNCFTVHTLGDGRYETLYHGGALASNFMTFKVID